MQPVKSPFLHPHIEVGGVHARDSKIQKFLEALYPQEAVQWVDEPDFKNIDTYILFYLCSYGEEDTLLIKQSFQHAQQLLTMHPFKPDVHLLIVFYHDLRVDFPDRKLQREKVMSEILTKQIFDQEMPYLNRIAITYEFGTHHLEDTLQQLQGSYLYFEVMK